MIPSDPFQFFCDLVAVLAVLGRDPTRIYKSTILVHFSFFSDLVAAQQGFSITYSGVTGNL